MEYHYSILDYFPYAIIFILVCIMELSAFTSKFKSRFIYYVLLLFTVLRYNVGWDYEMYKNAIFYRDFERFEPLSKLIFSICSIFNFYPLVFFVFGLLILYFTKISIEKYSSNYVVSWAVFIAFPFFFLASLSTLRQSLTNALILYSFHFAFQKKIYPFIVIILMSSLIHSSGIFGFFLYPIVNIKIKRNILFIITVISFFISPIIENIIKPLLLNYEFTQLNFYLQNNVTEKSTILQYIVYAVSFFNLIFYNKLNSIDDKAKIFIKLSSFGLIAYNILSFEPNSAFRIGAFFFSFWFYLFPLYSKIISYKIERFVNFNLVLILFVMFFLYLNILVSAYLNGILEKVGLLPYDFWFNNL
ncbi:hypothetical protein GCM10010992_26950 [Cloacibacterium rupense]|uniref:EpsG family protein n=1 Tax=Cloacibacterium rupense TaxID=517423 RepID=A0ABQ2NPN5_9FLAO|nr:EpsG family protein [Cloacibacterium rupense]GGP06540.1 hypothetical protein GCM10010992_26950 [Cloacibacterium rupense]